MSKKQQDRVTTNEIMEFLKDNMVTQTEFREFKDEMHQFKSEMGQFKITTEKRLDWIENHMVTKDYLDNKLADLGAEIGARINRRAEHEKKFKLELLAVLKHHALASKQELKRLEALV